MRVLLQRVARASVSVEGEIVAEIGPGLLLLVGAGKDDDASDATYLATKVAGLRIFPDDNGRMNRSVVEAGGSALVVSPIYTVWERPKGPPALVCWRRRSSGRSPVARPICSRDREP